MSSLQLSLENVGTHRADIVFAIQEMGLDVINQSSKDNKYVLLLHGDDIDGKITILLTKLQEYNPTYELYNKYSQQPKTKSLLLAAKTTTSESNLEVKIGLFNIIRNYVQCSNVVFKCKPTNRNDIFLKTIAAMPLMTIYAFAALILMMMQMCK
jgi:hypothetical protein